MNKRLYQLYFSKWGKLMKCMSNIYKDDDLLVKPTNPLLIKVINEYDYTSSDIRIMIFGQETNGWYEEDDTLEGVLNCYTEFLKDDYCFKYGGHFWNGVRRFVSMVSESLPDKKIGYIWNDLVKIDKSEGKGMPPDYIYNIERNFFSVIQDELSILQPNFIVFFTGPYYDRVLIDNFGRLDLIPIPSYQIKQFAKLKIGNIQAIRTYHPNYLWRNDINKFLFQ